MSAVLQNEPILILTEDAARQVRHLQATEPEKAGKPLRIYVEKGGCSGLQYGLTFDESREGDIQAACHGVDVVVDAFSADYLRGTVVDFKDDLNDSGFKITNPNARQNCGCGRSFEA
jgi:iron-sulfur cluster assembly accessory protein